MSRTQRLDDGKDQNLLTAEFTTGQLVVVICVSLFVAMACFGLGILVARLDPSLDSVQASSEDNTETVAEGAPMQTYTTRAFAQDAEDVPANAQRTPETPAPRNPYMDNTPRLTALPPLSPNRSLPTQVEAPSRTPLTEAPTQPEEETTAEVSAPATATPEPPPLTEAPAPTATTQTPTQEPEREPPLLTPITPEEPLLETAMAPQPVPAATGAFGVQLGAFSGSDRRIRAETFQRRVRAELQVDAAIIPSDDDVHYRVIVGGFGTREAAKASCEKLREKPGLNEAFVRPL